MNLSGGNERVARDEDLRAEAKRRSIALFIGDMNNAELDEVDAEVMKIRRRREAVGASGRPKPVDTRLKAALIELRDSPLGVEA